MEAQAMPAIDRGESGPHTYEEYLALPDDGRIVEWVDGVIIRAVFSRAVFSRSVFSTDPPTH